MRPCNGFLDMVSVGSGSSCKGNSQVYQLEDHDGYEEAIQRTVG